jgi:hypothetical protein
MDFFLINKREEMESWIFSVRISFFLFNFLVVLYTRAHALQEYYVGFFSFFF